MRALRAAADDARALAEGRASGHRALDARAAAAATPSSRSASRGARPTTSRPRGSSSPPAATPTRSARPRSRSSAGRADGHDHVPSVAGARRRRRPPDELRIDLDPQPGTDFADAVRVAAEARDAARRPRLRRLPEDLRAAAAIHIYVRIEPRWTFTDVRHAAIAFGRELERRLPGEVTTKWWKEERGERIFVDYNQNARDRTIASAYSIRPEAGRAGLGAARTGTSWPTSRPRTSRSRRCPRASPRSATATPRSTTSPTRSQPLLDLYERDEARATCPIRPTTRRCRASPSASSPRATATGRADGTAVRRLRQLLRAAPR